MQKTHSESFVRGAVLLGVSGIFIKILGAFFKIPLANLLGPEGMGYYSSAYPIYNFFIVVATAGLPTALAKIISEQRALEDYRNLNRTFKAGMILMVSIGLLGTFFMFFGADYLVSGIQNEGALYAFKALAPAVIFVSIMAVFRGYFQGFQHMKPFAISQIVEQLGRVVVGYGLAVFLLTRSTALASAGATFGATAGAVSGLLIIIWMFLRFQKKSRDVLMTSSDRPLLGTMTLLKRILVIAVPITIGAAIMPLMNTIDVVLVMNRLHDIGMGDQANDLYGMLIGYAATLVNLPQVVTAAVQISIVPAVAALHVKNQLTEMRQTIQNGVRMALMISTPATAGMVILAQPIMELLYPRQVEFAQTMGHILSILGFGVVFLGLYQVTTGILQGVSMQNRPAGNLSVGAITKVILTYVLVGTPSINIYGAAFSTVTAYGIASMLNIRTLRRHAGVRFDVKQVFLKPLLSSAVMGLTVKVVHVVLSMAIPGRLATVLAILVGMVVYVYMLFATKTLMDEDFDLLPGGAKLRRINNRFFKR
ncbi:MAG: stage sporulation protein [Clostridiales bacterium]|jgi:stage V sporulation protein B|nr:stage sporulation protein [Clostridiales bacterium]